MSSGVLGGRGATRLDRSHIRDAGGALKTGGPGGNLEERKVEQGGPSCQRPAPASSQRSEQSVRDSWTLSGILCLIQLVAMERLSHRAPSWEQAQRAARDAKEASDIATCLTYLTAIVQVNERLVESAAAKLVEREWPAAR